MKKSILATAIVSLYAPALFAQDTDSTKVDETIVVTANRFEQTQTSALASVSVVEREQIEQLQADSALDILNILPGVEVRSQGSRGSNSSIFIRGANSNQTLVLLDGVRLNTAAGGTITTLGVIPAFAIERIEVIRGPRASVYGADAIGGVISIKTKPQESNGQEISLSGGSNYSHSEGIKSSNDITESTNLHLIASNDVSKGYDITGLGVEDGYGFDSQFVSGSVEQQLTENLSTGFTGLYKQFENQNVGDSPLLVNRQVNEFYSLAAFFRHETEFMNSEFNINYSDESDTNGLDNSNAPTSTIDSSRTYISWINTFKSIESTTINAGIDYTYDKAKNSGFYYGPVTDFSTNTRNNTAVFTTAAVDLDSVLLEGSLRYDDNSAFGGNTTWGLGAGWFATESIQFTANYGTAFRAPTFFDLYADPSIYGSNPDLNAEKSKSFEFGIRGYHSLLTWNLVAYQNKIDDLIVYVPTSQFTAELQNISKAEITGIELSLDFDTGPVHHTLVGDWKDPEDKTTGEQLLRRAKQNYKWIASYSGDSFNAAVSSIYTGERPDFSETLDSYITVNLATTYYATDNLDINFKINNLFDEEYETAEGFSDQTSGNNKFNYIGPGREFYAGIDYRF
ncbi:TonB-dependent receptor domain-containing protein [Vibrio breoganii]|uniref:TonB-dependent receptor domain-containing protein n=1 Tax=Vibrio breoganii TaxID=553239 RepID=UPI000C82ACDE|nr:TonB-dependent receptor [Vibrio breoganii]PMM43789.1 hypothetical protein BCT52_00975 [Vibrio breoganii]